MKVLFHKELAADAIGITLCHVGGANDGQEFRTVEAHMEDGSECVLWRSNARDGYFKNVFVPHDFQHPEVIDS